MRATNSAGWPCLACCRALLVLNGFVLNGFVLNGLVLNGLVLNGSLQAQPGIVLTDVTAASGISFVHTDGSDGRHFLIESMSAIPDGTSNTLAMSEITIYNGLGLLRGHYTMVPSASFRAGPIICKNTRGLNGRIVGTLPPSHHRHGEAWAAGFSMIMGFNTCLPPNSPSCANAQGEWQEGIYPANSYHTGGVNASMCDWAVTCKQ